MYKKYWKCSFGHSGLKVRRNITGIFKWKINTPINFLQFVNSNLLVFFSYNSVFLSGYKVLEVNLASSLTPQFPELTFYPTNSPYSWTAQFWLFSALTLSLLNGNINAIVIALRASRWFPGKESAMQETRFDPWVRSYPEGRNGNPLQYSCLENPIDRGAWQAILHGVANSWTRTLLSTHRTHTHTRTHIHTRAQTHTPTVSPKVFFIFVF